MKKTASPSLLVSLANLPEAARGGASWRGVLSGQFELKGAAVSDPNRSKSRTLGYCEVAPALLAGRAVATAVHAEAP